MIFLVIFGALMLILGGFYLVNSWQRYREWKSGTIIVVLSLIAVAFGTINLPVFKGSHNGNQSSSSSQVSQSSLSNNFSRINGNQQADQNHEMDILRQLQKGYAKLGTVSFSAKNDTYTIKPTDDNTVQAIQAIVNDPSQAGQVGWSNLTDSIKKNSGQVSTALNGDYTIRIVNPDDSSQTVYAAKNGKTTHDIADNQ